MRPFAKILLILLMLSLLAGCVSPRTPALRCTVLFEDNPDLIMSDQVWEIRQNTSLSVSIGVPSGQRIDTVSYGSYSLSAKTGSSEHYDYYTLTLHQVRYSTVIRITTAPAYTTGYHFPECSIAGITVLEESPHLFFNTLAWNSGYTRDGYVPIGWNTQPDGSGEAVGFGSRIDHRGVSHMDLYIQWRSATPAQDLTWEQRGDGVYITGYRGQGDVVIPQTINGLTVTGIAAGAFPELTVQTLILPPTLQAVEAGAFGRVQAEDFYFFDSLCHLSEESFGSYCFTRIHIQAATAPVYSGSYFDTFSDKMDYLDSLSDTQKIVLFCGSSARFGYDSPMLEAAFPDYRVVNMGVYAYSNMLPQAMLVLQQMLPGDILLSSPELDAIDKQFCGDPALDREVFCMMEANYDLFARLDCRQFTQIFDAFSQYIHGRQDMQPRSYNDSAANYDEDGNLSLTATYNLQGDYILYRPNNTERISFGVKRACYNQSYIRQSDLDGLNRVYDAFADLGVTVLFTYSPRSAISITADSTEESILQLDQYLRNKLHAAVISDIRDSLMDPYYFWDTDNHLSTEGVQLHTAQVIQDLKKALDENGTEVRP